MTDTNRLNQAIRASGYRIAFIAGQLGLSYPGLKKKIDGETEFKASEIITLSNILDLTAEERETIFFAAE